MKLTKSQREHLADMFKDSANVVLAAMVIGQVIENTVKWLRVVGGLGIFFALVTLTTVLRKGGEMRGRS